MKKLLWLLLVLTQLTQAKTFETRLYAENYGFSAYYINNIYVPFGKAQVYIDTFTDTASNTRVFHVRDMYHYSICRIYEYIVFSPEGWTGYKYRSDEPHRCEVLATQFNIEPKEKLNFVKLLVMIYEPKQNKLTG